MNLNPKASSRWWSRPKNLLEGYSSGSSNERGSTSLAVVPSPRQRPKRSSLFTLNSLQAGTATCLISSKWHPCILLFFPYAHLSPLHLCQCGLRLGQPEGHVHGAIEVDSCGQFGTGLLSLAYLGDTEYQDPGGSALASDACQSPQPGLGPDGSSRQPDRCLEARAAWRPRRGAGRRAPGSHARCGCGKDRGDVRPGRWPRPCGRRGDRPRSAR